MRPTRKGQPEHASHLVEGLSRSIVESRTESGDLQRDVIHAQQRGVSSGHEQCDGGLGQVPMDKSIHRHVRREMVHAVQRLAQREREALGRTHSDQERTDETGSGRHGYRVHVSEVDPSLGGGPGQRGRERLQMGSASNLRHDPPEACLLVHTGGNGVGQQSATAHDSDPCFVAGGLDA